MNKEAVNIESLVEQYYEEGTFNKDDVFNLAITCLDLVRDHNPTKIDRLIRNISDIRINIQTHYSQWNAFAAQKEIKG